MKKILFLMAMLPMMLFTACSSDDENDTSKNDKYLYEIRVTEHKYKYGTAEEYGELYEDYIYDTNKNLLKKETNYYNPVVDDRIKTKYLYKYDENNRLIEENVDGLSGSKSFYSYNSNDLISKKIVYDNDGDLHETWTYEYDNTRKLIKSTVVENWLSNNFGYIHNYTYSGNEITETTYNLQDGTLFGITFDEYDSYGNLISNTWTNGETGKKTQQKGIAYEYNSKGQISKETFWTMDPNHLTYRNYTYNEDGTVQKVHISYSYKTGESELRYEYIQK